MQTWCNSGADCLLWIDFAGDPPGDQEKPLQICLGQFIILSLEVLTCHASQDVSLRHWHAEFQVTVSTSFYIYISYISLSLSQVLFQVIQEELPWVLWLCNQQLLNQLLSPSLSPLTSVTFVCQIMHQ